MTESHPGEHRESRAAARAIATVGARLLRSRPLMRAPIWIYRARLGGLLGSRMLMLEHIGRRTGVARQVVLEVFDHPATDTYVVASGFGDRAQWFRNVLANPAVRVSASGGSPAPAVARLLDRAQADRALAVYRGRHARAWARFKPVIEETLGEPVEDTDTALPMIELRLAPAAP